jgi:tetratricopeptide (TPR) repeat protein
MKSRLTLAMLLPALLASSGCAVLLRGGGTAPSGLTRADDRLRHLLADGRADSAAAALLHTEDGDELLRTVQAGVAAFYAGRAEESAALLERASLLVDERETRSVSRAALSLITNDLTLAWLPSPTERLLLPYYAGRAYIQAGDYEGATVEARRLTALLQSSEPEPSADEAALRGALHRFAGAIFEAAGRMNDARVAYRHAARYAGPSAPEEPLPDTAAAPAIPAGYGDVVVLVEQGFVAHRVEQAVHLFLYPAEVEALTDGDGEDKAAVAALLAAHVIAHALDPWDGLYDHHRRYRVPRHHRPFVEHKACTPRPGKATGTTGHGAVPDTAASAATSERRSASAAEDGDRRHGSGKDDRCDDDPGSPYLLKVAWPSYRASGRTASIARVVVDGDATHAAALANVSRAVVGDFGNDRALVIAKTIARAATKLALTRAAEEEIAEKDETAGRIVGLLANAGNVLLERADTRSLHLLPAGIGVLRLRLPAGDHDLTLEIDAGNGPRRITIDPVDVRDGGLTFATARAF